MMNYDYYKEYNLKLQDSSIYTKNGLSGLENIGNTCYSNSIIQCLSSTLELTDFFLTNQHLQFQHKKLNYEYYVVLSYMSVLTKLWDKNGIVVPKSLKENVGKFERKFMGVKQQDSHEYLVCLLTLLHKALSYEIDVVIHGESKCFLDTLLMKSFNRFKDMYENDYSIITKIFDGQFINTTECGSGDCEYIDYQFDIYRELSIGVEEDTLEGNLQNFFKSEILSDWKCERCGSEVNKRRLELWTIPNHLIIHLKRFDNNTEKIEKMISYPLTLDLTRYISDIKGCKSKHIYTLYAINCHSGDSKGGHYWSMTKRLDNQWYIFNDSDVSRVSDYNQLNTNGAYILFYYRTFIRNATVG